MKLPFIHKADTALIALIALNGAVFIAMALCRMTGHDISPAIGLPTSIVTLIRQPWCVVSYSFAQADILQLVFNMLWLYGFGRMLLMKHPQSCLIKLYITGALAGAAIFVTTAPLIDPSGKWLLLGSSAAVISVAAAVAVIMPDTEIPLPLLGPTKIKWIVSFVIIIFCIGLSSTNAGGNLAHIGGAVAGILYAFISLRSRNKNTCRHDELERLAGRIKSSGYDSLSAREKRRFFELSSKRK